MDYTLPAMYFLKLFFEDFMKVWKLFAANTLMECNEDLPVTLQDKEIKVKITKLLLTEQDYHAYAGDIPLQYPRIPVRCAIARVIDGHNKFGIEKNTQVFLQDNKSCRICPNCITDDDDCLNLNTAGIDYNGYLREFLVTDFDDVFILPTQISDKAALFISPLSLCLEVIDKLNIEVGEQVLIAGANYLGILLAQLLIYKKAIPILVDSSMQNLDLARRVGVYYTFLDDANLYNNLKQITVGRFFTKSIFTNACTLNPMLVQQLTTYGGLIIFAGFYFKEMFVSMKSLHAKGITVRTINNGSKNKENAINLLANKMIDVALFPTIVEPIANIKKTYSSALSQL